MEAALYHQTARVEDEHWWFVARNRMVERRIRSMRLPSDARILDLGCGTGGTTRFLESFGHVTGVDRSPLAVETARQKVSQARIVEGDICSLDRLFPPESFDLVTMFCVMYHRWVADEVALLRKIATVLKPGGRLLLAEPAFPCLMRSHDQVGQGCRRYRLHRIQALMTAAGLTCTQGDYFNAAAFPLCLAAAVASRLRRRTHDGANGELSELSIPPAWLNRALARYLTLEDRIGQFVPLPFGVTLMAVGIKGVPGTSAANHESAHAALTAS